MYRGRFGILATARKLLGSGHRTVRGWSSSLKSPHAPEPRAAGSSGSGACPHRIDQFSYFKGRIWLSGSVGPVSERIEAITLRTVSDERLIVPFEASGIDRVTFQVALDTGASVAEVAQASLQVRFVGGAVSVVENLGYSPEDPAHALMERFISGLRSKESGRLLEIGSRARSGNVRRDLVPANWSYEGLDVLDGPNVDTVGDAHRLTALYPTDSFDAVMAISVLEHLLMPWKFVVELNRILKPGAVGIFATHQCWPLHDEPWDFWRFSDRAWTALLNPATGFEILDARMGEPAYVVAARLHGATAFEDRPAGGLASFVLFRKIGATRLEWPVELAEVLTTAYPAA